MKGANSLLVVFNQKFHASQPITPPRRFEPVDLSPFRQKMGSRFVSSVGDTEVIARTKVLYHPAGYHAKKGEWKEGILNDGHVPAICITGTRNTGNLFVSRDRSTKSFIALDRLGWLINAGTDCFAETFLLT